MAENYSILLAGLTSSEESLALNHFVQSGHRVVAARDVGEAKEKAKNQAVDLVLLRASADLKAVDELKEAKHLASLPIVLICTHDREGLVHDIWQAEPPTSFSFR